MANVKRRRSIHPGLHNNKKVVRNSIHAGWLFTAIFTNADDFGYVDADPEKWKLEAFPRCALIQEDDQILSRDQLLALVIADKIVEPMDDGNYRVMGIRSMIDTLSTRVRSGETPLLERCETTSGEAIVYSTGWDEAQTFRSDIKRQSNYKDRLKDKDLDESVSKAVRAVVEADTGRVRAGTQSNEVSKKVIQEHPARQNRAGIGSEVDILGDPEIIDIVHREFLKRITIALKQQFGSEFDWRLPSSKFVGWAFVQQFYNLSRDVNRNPIILASEIKQHSKKTSGSWRGYLQYVFKNKTVPDPPEGPNRPAFYDFDSWAEGVSQNVKLQTKARTS